MFKKGEEDQEKFKLDLSEIKRRKLGHKLEERKHATKNIKDLQEGQEKIIKVYNDYTRMVSDAKCKTINGKGLKTLTSKQVLQ